MSRFLARKDLVREMLRGDDHDRKTIALLTFLCMEVIDMSAELDALTSQVGVVETQVTAVVAEVQALKSASDTAALPALTTRLQSVSAQLTSILPTP